MNKGTLVPVIHMLDDEQVMINVSTCLSEGIKKVFLIHHGLDNGHLLRTAEIIKNRHPELWIGVNLLGVPTTEVLKMELPFVDAVWTDDGLTHLSWAQLEEIFALRKFKGLFFGGIAFKYQKQPSDLKEACDKAIRFIDVPTTSGAGTGKAATTSKIKEIKSFLNEKPLALASGIDSSNISNYVGNVDYYLVASSITDEGEIINENKLGELRDILLEIETNIINSQVTL